jgi:endoglucanase
MVIRFIKHITLVLLALTLTQCTGNNKASSAYSQSWQAFKQHYVDDGRIVDTANSHISHSEGQGYGMLFAAFADDKVEFTKIWAWTSDILQRDDSLFSWKYEPCEANNRDCIADLNNATDGDILIAWALIVAAERWDKPEYKTQALAIIQSIEQKLLRNRFGYQLLIPGEYGFDHDDTRLQINLSYWVFPALIQFEQVTGNEMWSDVIDSGERLLLKAQFGRWKVTPDWIMISDNGLDFDGTLSQEYGYNACRVPIYLMLAQNKDQQLIQPYLTFWAQPVVPATVNLQNGSVATYPYTSGMQAIAKATNAIMANKTPSKLANITAETDYYSASLIMLSHLALSPRQ